MSTAGKPVALGADCGCTSGGVSGCGLYEAASVYPILNRRTPRPPRTHARTAGPAAGLALRHSTGGRTERRRGPWPAPRLGRLKARPRQARGYAGATWSADCAPCGPRSRQCRWTRSWRSRESRFEVPRARTTRCTARSADGAYRQHTGLTAASGPRRALAR